MREIDFRGFSISKNDWVYGDLYRLDYLENCVHPVIIENGIAYDVFEQSVGQYVELLDAYEGDILFGHECVFDDFNECNRVDYWCGQIKFNKERGRIMIFDESDRGCKGECDGWYDGWYELDEYVYTKVLRV